MSVPLKECMSLKARILLSFSVCFLIQYSALGEGMVQQGKSVNIGEKEPYPNQIPLVLLEDTNAM